ncbi:hypothetical protein BDF22DRAFT_745730 [Syncephalis plumigaleata]|nr:hypothetical protein BDF22DRAFT_745730 [Syncephalis plumigaleata]
MTLCVSAAAPGMLEQTQSPPLAQPTATMRRHRRRSSHHLLMALPARPVSTSPYINNPPYPTHRPRPVTPEDNQQPFGNIGAVGSLIDDNDCNPIPRSQSVRLSRDADGGNAPPLRPLDILAPCPKKAGGRVGSGWQRWMAAFPPTSTAAAPETDSRQSGRMLARPLSFCFGEDLELDGDITEMNDRIASLQREFSNTRQARVEAEAEAEALAPVVVDLSLSASSEAPLLDDLMRVSAAPTTAPLPGQQPSSNVTYRPKITIPTDREKQSNRGPISAAGESAAMAELMGIFSNPSGSPTSLVGGELPIPPMPTLVESDNTTSATTAGLQVAIPATTPTLTAILEAAIMGGDSDTDNDSSSNSQYNSDYDHVNSNTSSNNTEQPTSWRTSGDFTNVENNSESTRKSRKLPPPRLSVNTSVADMSSNNSNNSSSLSATSVSSVTSLDQAIVATTTTSSVTTLSSDTVMTSDHQQLQQHNYDEDINMLERGNTPTLISSLTMLQPHLDDSINPGDIGRSPIVRTTNPVPLDWSFATTPRVPKHPIAPIGPTDVADDDDSDLVAAAAANNHSIYNNATLPATPSSLSITTTSTSIVTTTATTTTTTSSSSNVPLSGQLTSETIVNGGVHHAMAAAATANFLSIAPPGRPSAPLNAATHAIPGADGSTTGAPPAGYQRPRSFSVSVASARTATLNRLGLRRI